MGYFLVARNVETNDFKIIELKSKWYLKNGTDVLCRSNPLEVIDLVTTRFKSKEEMAKRLMDNHYIPHNNYDFFIVSKYKNKGVEKLKFQEIIYNRKASRIDEFRIIAYNSLNKRIKCQENIRLLDKFMNKNYYSSEYSKIVNDRLTGLSKKFIDTFGKIRNYENIPYVLKYKNPWSYEDYGISRSIIDSFNRFDDLNYGDVYKNHIYYFKNLTSERMKIYKKLLEVCDKEYIEGQLSIFDQPIIIEENKKEENNPIEKRKYVINTLKNLGLSKFVINEDKISISTDELFEEVTNEEAKILKKGLNSKVLKAAYLYNLHYDKINTEGTTAANYAVLQEDLNADLNDLKKSLKDDKIIERTYNFFKTIDDIKKKSLSKDVKTYQKNRDKK